MIRLGKRLYRWGRGAGGAEGRDIDKLRQQQIKTVIAMIKSRAGECLCMCAGMVGVCVW